MQTAIQRESVPSCSVSCPPSLTRPPLHLTRQLPKHLLSQEMDGKFWLLYRHRLPVSERGAWDVQPLRRRTHPPLRRRLRSEHATINDGIFQDLPHDSAYPYSDPPTHTRLLTHSLYPIPHTDISFPVHLSVRLTEQGFLELAGSCCLHFRRLGLPLELLVMTILARQGNSGLLWKEKKEL